MKSRLYIPNWFWCFISLAILHQIAEKILHIRVSIFDNYLDPLLLMPILLHLVRLERNMRNGYNYLQLSSAVVFTYFIIISFICEYVFPKYKTGFTSDPWDILCYFIGSMAFILFMNKPVAPSAGEKRRRKLTPARRLASQAHNV